MESQFFDGEGEDDYQYFLPQGIADDDDDYLNEKTFGARASAQIFNGDALPSSSAEGKARGHMTSFSDTSNLQRQVVNTSNRNPIGPMVRAG